LDIVFSDLSTDAKGAEGYAYGSGQVRSGCCCCVMMMMMMMYRVYGRACMRDEEGERERERNQCVRIPNDMIRRFHVTTMELEKGRICSFTRRRAMLECSRSQQ
jgi:hypothetical protein